MRLPETGYEETLLSSDVTIRKYRELEAAENRDAIADFIYQRFYERYLRPLASVPEDERHGFCMMAIACLMIEALETIRQGWQNSKGKSTDAFGSFFGRAKNAPLSAFQDHATNGFYQNVRCGILHQAETTGGWRIRRDGPLFDAATKTINATKFLAGLEQCLLNYCSELRESDWDSDVWLNLRHRLNATCQACRQDCRRPPMRSAVGEGRRP